MMSIPSVGGQRVAAPRPAALPEMATAVLILDEERRVEYANRSARTLFDPIDPIGCSMPALWASCGASDVAAEPGDKASFDLIRVQMGDDRRLDGTMRLLSSGGFVLSLDDVTELIRNAELARRDALTGLANRAALFDQFTDQLHMAERDGRIIAILYIDLDRFKTVNDTLGHPIGDSLLCKVADRIRSALRDGDFVARLGGDEFAVIQSGAVQPEGAHMLATRLVDLIGRAYAVEGHIIHIGATVGIALFPHDGREADILFKNADLALYRAKADGRGCLRFYEPSMDQRMQRRRAMEIDLRRALALKQFELEYQPQFELATGRLVGFEALLRWNHPERGRVSPADFIPLAEDIGVIVPLGEWVLRTACHEAARWPAPLSVAVNLSPVQFRNGRLFDGLSAELARARLSPDRLDVEITEGALLSDDMAVIETLEALRRLGVKVSMDDFGTGYSSLAYLQKFPFDKVKIDQSFVRGIDGDPRRRAIVRAITTLAGALGMRSVAEGVETEAERACVKLEGCTEVQGYLTGRPQSAENSMAMAVAHASKETGL